MKILLPALVFASLLSASAAWEVTETVRLGSLPKGGAVVQTQVAEGHLTACVTAIIFSARSYSLRVVESPSPGSTKLAGVLAAAGCVAGVNGGYFQADFRPVGLVIAAGREVHAFEKAKLLAGVLAVRGRGIEIVRAARFKNSGDVREAIQCGPVLVENGSPTTGLNAERSARRTIVATDGHGQWALIYITSVTLADSARILTTPGVLRGVATALNLDGGSSSGLWAASTPSPVSLPELGHVRNYLGIAPGL
ncbi:MAG: phosphodiester glycosidase family protein [Verrucomicrobiae bacterium]